MALGTWAPPKPSSTGATSLDRFFHITERGSTVRTELIAGAATWLTMAYILFVNPTILGFQSVPALRPLGLPFDQVLTVTALVAGVMTLLMGVYANYPFALAAGLGLNAFVAFTLVVSLKLSYPDAMGVIVLEGLAITVLVMTGFREAVLNAIPMDLKRAIGIGIGMFIAFIGLVSAGVVVHPPAGTILTIAGSPDSGSDLTTLRMLTFVIGLAITATLVARKTRGALLLGIVLTTVIAAVINTVWGHGHLWTTIGPDVARLPHKWVTSPDFGLFGKFSITGVFDALPVATAIAVILSVMLSDFFDTMGTVVGIAGEAKLLDRDGKLPGMNRVLLVDSLAAAAGGVASASSNTTYIESAAGVSEGGRTGLTSVVVGVLFLLSLFLSSLAGVIPPEATAPILVLVGYFMMTLVKDINWLDAGVAIPALLTIIVQPFTFSITNGVGAGFLSYTVISILRGDGLKDLSYAVRAVAQGRWSEFRTREWKLHPLMIIVSAVFAWYFIHGLIA
jgi:adenine/guanine/hypoxanthine permease